MTLEQQILTIVKERPGLSVKEICEFFPDRPRSSISGRTSMMIADGRLRREMASNPEYVRRGTRPVKIGTMFIGTGKAVIKPRKALPKCQPSSALLDHLRTEIETLKAWKADAIARYPDLAVDPLLLKARQIVAKTVRSKGDAGSEAVYQQVMSGARDESVAVLATLEALTVAA